jgi:hypothetical protein
LENFTLLSEMTVNDNPVYLYEYTAFPGRFLLYSQVVSVADENSMMQKLVDQSVDLRKEVVVLSKEAKLPGRASAGGKVEVVSYEPNRVILNYEAAEEAFCTPPTRSTQVEGLWTANNGIDAGQHGVSGPSRFLGGDTR